MANVGKLWGHWTFAVALAVGCAVGCGDDDHGPKGAAGSGGEAGGSGRLAGNGGDGGSTAGQGGAGGVMGGMGGTASCEEGGDCPHLPYCGPYPLSQRCTAARPCPSLSELQDDCSGQYETRTQQATTCGQVIEVNYDLFGSAQYGFDEDGKLISVVSHSDAYRVCAERNGSSASTLYGAVPCEPIGQVVELCNAGAGGGGAGGAGGGGAGGASGAGGAP